MRMMVRRYSNKVRRGKSEGQQEEEEAPGRAGNVSSKSTKRIKPTKEQKYNTEKINEKE
jgi:hypothetical protein